MAKINIQPDFSDSFCFPVNLEAWILVRVEESRGSVLPNRGLWKSNFNLQTWMLGLIYVTLINNVNVKYFLKDLK
jgi:hypothetical protein